MKLERLDIRGFMHFRDVATLDLRDVPPGLVAITGENGNGKTRLLDAALGSLYQAFPSRDGSLADYATERDAYVESVFSIEGRGVYRSRINVDGQKRNSDAVLQVEQIDGGWGPLNDGKVSTHRDAVAKVFPPKELVLASAFAAQNRAGSFVTLGKKDRKDLFATLLGLAHYERMAATAKACFDLVEATRARLAERRDLLAAATSDELADAMQQRANALQAEGGKAELRRVELRARIADMEADRPALMEQAQAHLAKLAQQHALTETIGARTAERDRLDVDAQEVIAAYALDYAALNDRRELAEVEAACAERTARETYDAKVKDLDDRIAGNETLNTKAADIRAAAADKAAALEQLERLRGEREAALDQKEQAEKQVSARQRQLDGAAATRLAAAKLQADTLDHVPCGGAGEYAACQFLAQARDAKASLDELETAVRHADTLAAGITLWTEKAKEYAELAKAKAIAIAQVEARIKDLDKLAKYEPELAATEARLEGYRQGKVDAETTLTARLAELTELRSRIHADYLRDRDALVARRDQRLAGIDAQRGACVRALEAAEQQRRELTATLAATEAAARNLVLLDESIATTRDELTEVEKTLAGVAARRDELQRERQAFVAKVQERSEVEDRLRTAEDRLLVWQTCCRMFGRDGLPTLEIAAAGPTVSNLTNDLLSACFGTRFTVELVTQEPKADGKGMKECFELKVFDNEHGGDPRDIADLSGGERVIVDEALRAALALYVNSRNVAPIRTCWRDETTGALDPENATRYVAMLRKLHELGGFAHVIYITHNPDAAALADTQIVVKHGQPELRRAA